jgi:hypothetical protein
MGCGLAAEAQELNLLAQQTERSEETSAFSDDLADWLSWHSLRGLLVTQDGRQGYRDAGQPSSGEDGTNSGKSCTDAGQAASGGGGTNSGKSCTDAGQAASGGGGTISGMLPALIVEARRTEMVAMMSEVRRWGYYKMLRLGVVLLI